MLVNRLHALLTTLNQSHLCKRSWKAIQFLQLNLKCILIQDTYSMNTQTHSHIHTYINTINIGEYIFRAYTYMLYIQIYIYSVCIFIYI